jgi:transcriptional regulator with XRE-family HTH domain
MLGLGQKEMAELAGCSKATVQSVELGKLKLSDDLAARIAAATGISLGWLLKGNLKAPPTDRFDAPYSKAVFEDYRARRYAEKEFPAIQVEAVKWFLEQRLCEMAGLLYSACKRRQAPLFAYRVSTFIEALEKEFGGRFMFAQHGNALTKNRRAKLPVTIDALLAEFDKLKRVEEESATSKTPSTVSKTSRKPAQG